jgi:hypothetical protein
LRAFELNGNGEKEKNEIKGKTKEGKIKKRIKIKKGGKK